MTDKNDSQEISPLSAIVENVARARQMAEDNDLELLSYMLQIAECEAKELVAKADGTQDTDLISQFRTRVGSRSARKQP
ncbi:hypothetical protein [Rhizobium rhizogenes]|uniref:hypothetical protein n=1 Tax=Rhizobium rhizogenes TaxID=359 RepID=UPI0015749960|nr:hypothetical protein [Rhizobium rhizogenes]NTG05326.1 hypothetical protein [Rhizobium rhizogenes]NTG11912.1 hypothetical protein [Rhizobium rhizogenes]